MRWVNEPTGVKCISLLLYSQRPHPPRRAREAEAVKRMANAFALLPRLLKDLIQRVSDCELHILPERQPLRGVRVFCQQIEVFR